MNVEKSNEIYFCKEVQYFSILQVFNPSQKYFLKTKFRSEFIYFGCASKFTNTGLTIKITFPSLHLWIMPTLLKDKSGPSEKSQVLGDESRILIGGLSKKDTQIYDSDISENGFISDI